MSGQRPKVFADDTVLPMRRWLVTYQGHLYPFPSHARAIEAASDPAHLCKYTCICPVAKHRWGAA